MHPPIDPSKQEPSRAWSVSDGVGQRKAARTWLTFLSAGSAIFVGGMLLLPQEKIIEMLPSTERPQRIIVEELASGPLVTEPLGIVDTFANQSEVVFHQLPTTTSREVITNVAATSARILIVGDIMLDRNVASRSKAAGTSTYPFQKLPEQWFASYDFAVANLEGPVTAKSLPPVKSIDFRFDPSVVPVLRSQGIDALSQANNHALDQGQVGFDDSRKRLRDAGFVVFGHQVRDDVISMATTTVNGFRLALVGFNTTDNSLDRAAASAALSEARSIADRVIVLPHWGSEYHNKPDSSVVELGHWLIDHGADAVIGGHPHWYQGISVYKNKPIAWSLGNFIFDQDFSVQTNQGLAVALTFDQDKTALEPLPIHIVKSQPSLVDAAAKEKRLEDLAKISDAALRDQILRGRVEF